MFTRSCDDRPLLLNSADKPIRRFLPNPLHTWGYGNGLKEQTPASIRSGRPAAIRARSLARHRPQGLDSKTASRGVVGPFADRQDFHVRVHHTNLCHLGASPAEAAPLACLDPVGAAVCGASLHESGILSERAK